MPLAAFPKCFLTALCDDHSMSVEDWISLSQSFDLDGVEFYWGFVPPDDPAQWNLWRSQVAAQGRSIPMLCYSSDFTWPDYAKRKEEIQRQKQAIHAAHGLGATYCRVLSGQKRPEVSPDQGLQWVAECIQECLPEAEKNGITLILENHYKDGYWEYPEFAQRHEMFLKLLDRIPNVPHFGVNYDPSNTIIAGEDPIRMLHAVKHRVKTMHASDRYFENGDFETLKQLEAHPFKGYADILKHGVIGKGLNDYDQIFSILKEEGFQGWISIEDGPDPETGVQDIRESAVFLRKKMKQYGLP